MIQYSVVILNIQVENIPHASGEQHLTSDDLRFKVDGISHLHAMFGFQDDPNVPATLHLAVERGLLDAACLEEITYFLSRITVVRSSNKTMPAWQKLLFGALSHNFANPVDYFGLPIEDPSVWEHRFRSE